MERYQNPLLFIAGLITGGAVVFVLLMFLRRGPEQELENMQLKMELLEQQSRMMQLQIELQDSAIAGFKAILADTTAAE